MIFATLLIATTVSAGERTPAVIWVIVPKDVALRTESQTYVDAAAAVLNKTTRLGLVSAERAGIDLNRLDACAAAERYKCWLAEVRRDAPDTLPQRRRTAPRYFFALAVQPNVDNTEALSLIFLDTDRAREKVAAIPSDAPDRAEQIETEIFNLTVRASPVQVDSMNRAELERWFAERLEGPIRALLVKNDDAGALGRIAVYAPQKNWPLALDGEVLAATSSTTLVITDVLPGVRRVAIAAPKGPPFARDVRVEPARTATVTFGLEPMAAASEDDGTVRYGLIFGGITAASVGGVLLASALARGSNVREACVLRTGDAGPGDCANVGTITLSHNGAGLPALDPGRVNPSGVLMAPLAIGMLGGGAIIAGGALYLKDFERDWWWPVVLGLGFTAAVYGFGVLVDAR